MSIHVKNSPRERVRVSHGLARAYTRYYRDPKRTVSSALFGICILQTFEGFDQGDALLKLADLIDPTCEVRSRRNAPMDSDSVYEYDLSCGHTVSDIDGEAPTYCPLCGRRIVGEYDPCKGSCILPEGGPEAVALLQEMGSGSNVLPGAAVGDDEPSEPDGEPSEPDGEPSEPDTPSTEEPEESPTEPEVPVAAAVASDEGDLRAATATTSADGRGVPLATTGTAPESITVTTTSAVSDEATASATSGEAEVPVEAPVIPGEAVPGEAVASVVPGDATPAAAPTTASVASIASPSPDGAPSMQSALPDSAAGQTNDSVGSTGILGTDAPDQTSAAGSAKGSAKALRNSRLGRLIASKKGRGPQRGKGGSSPSQSPSAA